MLVSEQYYSLSSNSTVNFTANLHKLGHKTTRNEINILQYYATLYAFNVILKWVLHNLTQYYMYITLLLNITCIWGSNTVVLNSILLNITYNMTQYYMPNHTILQYYMHIARMMILGGIQ